MYCNKEPAAMPKDITDRLQFFFRLREHSNVTNHTFKSLGLHLVGNSPQWRLFRSNTTPPPPTPETHLLGRCEGSEMCNNPMLELHASNGQTHQSRPGSMVFPQFTKIPVTLVFNKTNSLGEKQKRTKIACLSRNLLVC